MPHASSAEGPCVCCRSSLTKAEREIIREVDRAVWRANDTNTLAVLGHGFRRVALHMHPECEHSDLRRTTAPLGSPESYYPARCIPGLYSRTWETVRERAPRAPVRARVRPATPLPAELLAEARAELKAAIRAANPRREADRLYKMAA